MTELKTLKDLEWKSLKKGITRTKVLPVDWAIDRINEDLRAEAVKKWKYLKEKQDKYDSSNREWFILMGRCQELVEMFNLEEDLKTSHNVDSMNSPEDKMEMTGDDYLAQAEEEEDVR